MAYRHGKNTIVLWNGSDLSPYFNEATSARTVETAESTTFGASAKTYVVGLQDGTMSMSGVFDGAADAVDDVLTDTIGADGGDVVTVGPDGTAAGRAAFSAAVKQTSYEVTSPVGDIVSTSVEVQGDGGVDRGILLAGLSAVTSTGQGSAQDNTTSTTAGAVGYLHVTANTRDGSSTFKVQHSADNVTYADLITFTAIGTSTTGGERVAVSGTVNRYVRASHTPGGSSGSVTYTMAFARK